jgi:probable HAF family extracellular repeat protein
MRRLRVSFAVLMIVAMSALSAAQQYTVTDLGTLGGDDGDNAATAINDHGEVAGYSPLSVGPPHGYVWTSHTGMLDLGSLPGDTYIYAYGINNSRQVVGLSYGITTSAHAFLWTGRDGMQNIGTLGGSNAAAYAINNLGQVVGDSSPPDNVGGAHAFLWSQTGGMQDLGTLGGTVSIAYGINDLGEVVGYSLLADNVTQHPFIWTASGGMQDLDLPNGAPLASARGINAFGNVVGLAQVRTQSAFFWLPTGRTVLIGSLGGDNTGAFGINAGSQVVGFSQVPTGEIHGFLWSRGTGMQDLNDLISPPGYTVMLANAINRVGQIAATGDNNHSLLLTPTKQPSSQRSKP